MSTVRTCLRTLPALALVLFQLMMAPAANALSGTITVNPTFGLPGQTVVFITGNGVDNFQSAGVTSVTVGGQPAAYTILSPTLIRATVPCDAALGVGNVVVQDGPSIQAAFTVYTPPAPTVSNFVPTTGPVGAVLKITGTNYVCVSGVTVGNTAAKDVSVVSTTEIRATVDTGATNGPVTVTNPGGFASVGSFKVDASAPAINSFYPGGGAAGTIVDIYGLNFTNPPTVRFNGVPASVLFVSATDVRAMVPSGATTGPISLTATGGTATSLDNFVVPVTVPVPVITSFAPLSGPVGTAVTIYGANFIGATWVTFNGLAQPSFRVDPSGTVISTSVPNGASTGPIWVVTPYGWARSPNAFVVTVQPQRYDRALSLHVWGKVQAAGYLTMAVNIPAGYQYQPVEIQFRGPWHWWTVKTTWTNGHGRFKVHLPDRDGWYRAWVAQWTLPTGEICGQAYSPDRWYS